MSVPQTNSAEAANGAWNSGIGIPSSLKYEMMSGRWVSFPQPVCMNSQPRVMRDSVGGSQDSLPATAWMNRRNAAALFMIPFITPPFAGTRRPPAMLRA